MLTNLLVNAQQALEGEPQPRQITLRAACEGEAVTIEVADNGPGIPADLRSRVFDPFFTTKPVGAGTGIGLAVSRGIVEAHGGALSLATSDRGAHFVVRLPLRELTRNGAENGNGQAVASARTKRSGLIVDDEKEVGQILSEMLQVLGIHCDVVTSGETAIERLSKQSYDVVISDVRLPGIDGPALYTWIAENKPDLCARTAFVTGDTLGQASERFLADAKRPLLEKPFLPTDVRRLIEELLHANGG